MGDTHMWRTIDPPIEIIYNILYQLGAVANTVTFFYTSYAILLSIQDPDRLEQVTKLLYPDVAKYYGTTKEAVERGIRRTIDQVWETNPQLLSKIAESPFEDKPSATKFLSTICSHLVNA